MELEGLRVEMAFSDLDDIKPAPATAMWTRAYAVRDAEILLTSSKRIGDTDLELRIRIDKLAGGAMRVSRSETGLATLRELDATIDVPIAGDTRVSLRKGQFSVKGALCLKDTSFAYRPPPARGATTEAHNKQILAYLVDELGKAGLNQVWISAVRIGKTTRLLG